MKNNQKGSVVGWVLGIVVLIIIIWAVYYFMHSNSSTSTPMDMTQTTTTTNTSDTGTGTNPGAASAAPVQNLTMAVSISNFAFSPASITVKQGTTVTWTNNDSVAHTVTSDTGSTLSSGNIAPGQSFSFTFTTPGTFAYHCAIHPQMKGTVIVE